VIVLLLACTSPDTDSSSDSVVDDGRLNLVEDFPDAPEGGLALRSPVMEIPPYSEVLLCYFGTYEGPTVGVDFMQPLQSDYSHHNQLKAVWDGIYDDGELIDCATSAEMSEYSPLFESVGIEPGPDTAEGNWLNLPDGIAMKLEGGQRWVMDMHYINPTDQTLVVQNGVNIGVLPVEEVEDWAGSIQFDAGLINIAAGADHQETFDCAFEQPGHVLSVLGHMHSRGTHYSVDYGAADAPAERIYDVVWEGDYHPYYPELTTYAPGEFPVAEGETFTTTCDWTNFEDHDLEFPEEMCTTVVVVYPLERPRTCIEGVYRD
jgi:hypothetical protein